MYYVVRDRKTKKVVSDGFYETREQARKVRNDFNNANQDQAYTAGDRYIISRSKAHYFGPSLASGQMPGV